MTLIDAHKSGYLLHNINSTCSSFQVVLVSIISGRASGM